VTVSQDYLAYVTEQLAPLGRVEARRIFGGVGLYCEGLFFALIDDDALYLKADDGNRPDFEARGCAPFRPFKDKPEYSMSYYQPPADVLEDAEQLAAWARKSIAAARAAARSGKASKRRTGTRSAASRSRRARRKKSSQRGK
jgi:DNA transformation protein